MAKMDLKLSDLAQVTGVTKDNMELVSSKTTENARDEHQISMNKQTRSIKDKIGLLEKKIQKHELKEGMLDRIINQTYTELENLKENEFTRRGQKQTILIKQLEALSVLHDTIIKYEDMVQKYHKINIDIENNKLNSFIKVETLKKEEIQADESINSILIQIQEQLKAGSSTMTSPLLDEIQQELNDSGY